MAPTSITFEPLPPVPSLILMALFIFVADADKARSLIENDVDHRRPSTNAATSVMRRASNFIAAGNVSLRVWGGFWVKRYGLCVGHR